MLLNEPPAMYASRDSEPRAMLAQHVAGLYSLTIGGVGDVLEGRRAQQHIDLQAAVQVSASAYVCDVMCEQADRRRAGAVQEAVLMAKCSRTKPNILNPSATILAAHLIQRQAAHPDFPAEAPHVRRVQALRYHLRDIPQRRLSGVHKPNANGSVPGRL
jgi:hypothetical protein